jgi:cytidylate kinase
MCVLTISRETGSGGRYIAENVSKALGYALVDKHTIGRICGQYGRNEFGWDVGYVPEFWSRFDSPSDDQRALMVYTLNQVILGLAHRDNIVILGRSSFAVLAGFADVLSVRIQAPLPVRIQRVMARRNIATPEQAEALVRESDRVRAAFIEGFYGSRWDTAKSFDAVIDTAKVSEELASTWLVQAVQDLHSRPLSGERTVSTILVDPLMVSILAEELSYQAA